MIPGIRNPMGLALQNEYELEEKRKEEINWIDNYERW